MGWPMAACLVKAGFHCQRERLPARGRRTISSSRLAAFAPDTLRQLAAESDVIVTMLPTSVIVEHVLAGGDDNVFAGMKPGTIVIEMSSGVPSVTQRLAEQVAALGGHLIDGPVSGGVPRAKTGATRDHGRRRRGDHRPGDAGAVGDGHVGAEDRRGRLRPGDEGAEQPGQHRRLPDRDRGAADRPAFRSRSRRS